MLLYQGQDENFFLAMVEPPRRAHHRHHAARPHLRGGHFGLHARLSARYGQVLLRELIGGLRPSDTFNVLLFSGSNRFLNAHSVPATQANIAQAIRTIDQMGGGGNGADPGPEACLCRTQGGRCVAQRGGSDHGWS